MARQDLEFHLAKDLAHDSWVFCPRSWPRSKIMAASFLPLAQDSSFPGQESSLPGQDSCLPSQDSCLPGQDSHLPGQDSCLPVQDSNPFYSHDQLIFKTRVIVNMNRYFKEYMNI